MSVRNGRKSSKADRNEDRDAQPDIERAATAGKIPGEADAEQECGISKNRIPPQSWKKTGNGEHRKEREKKRRESRGRRRRS